MIPRYRLLAERLRAELEQLAKIVTHAEGALERAQRQVQEQDYFMAAAALDLHSFYAGFERLFELIASELEKSRPASPQWHRDLLAQMALHVPGLRPAVLRRDTQAALAEYLEFRHIVRNVYTFNLRPERVAELTRNLRAAFEMAKHDFLSFAEFLDHLADADE